MPSNALEGLKVLDFGWVAAVPIMTLQLAQHGAHVVRAESSARPDASRATGPFVDEQHTVSAAFMQLNGDKQSLGINLKHPDAGEVIRELVVWADVLTENYRPGTLEKLGLSHAELHRLNPALVVLRSSSAGQTGPWSTMAATGDLLQSLCGFTELTGQPDEKPMPPWGAWTDITVPPIGVVSILAAVRQARRTGQGVHMDMSQHELSLGFLADEFLAYQATGQEPQRQGNADSNISPHGLFPTVDGGWIAIEIHTNEQWQRLAGLLGHPEWATCYANAEQRRVAEQLLAREIGAWTSQHGKKSAMQRLQELGIPAGYVADPAEVRHDPQLAHRAYFQFPVSAAGPVLAPAAAYTMSRTTASTLNPAPELGEHSWQVCAEILGMEPERIAELMASGAIE